MKNLRNTILIALVLISFNSCTKEYDCISGNGNSISKEYIISDFNKLAVHGEANVYISKGETTSLRIVGESNVMSVLDVEVNNGELSIGEDNCFKNIERLNIYVSTSTLNGLSGSGLCNFYSPDKFTSSTFFCEIEGDGKMELNMDTQEFDATISGTGYISAKGAASNQFINISGDGDIKLFDLMGSNADITFDGMGDVEVNVSSKLKVRISGAGNVYYKGNPSIDQKISGSGTVVNAN